MTHAAVAVQDPEVARLADRIRQRMRRSAEDIIEIGKDLTSVKNRLGHGEFGPWLDTEFGWSYPTAARFMQVANAFAGKSSQIENFAPSALYALAADNVPEPVRERFIEQAERGEPVRFADVREALRPDPAPSPSPTALPVEDIDGPPLYPRQPDPGRFAIVDRDSGEIVGRAEPIGAPTVAAVGRLPEIRQKTDEERVFDELVRMGTALRYDAGAVAEAALAFRGESARAWARSLPGLIRWLESVADAIDGDGAALRVVR